MISASRWRLISTSSDILFFMHAAVLVLTRAATPSASRSALPAVATNWAALPSNWRVLPRNSYGQLVRSRWKVRRFASISALAPSAAERISWPAVMCPSRCWWVFRSSARSCSRASWKLSRTSSWGGRFARSSSRFSATFTDAQSSPLVRCRSVRLWLSWKIVRSMLSICLSISPASFFSVAFLLFSRSSRAVVFLSRGVLLPASPSKALLTLPCSLLLWSSFLNDRMLLTWECVWAAQSRAVRGVPKVVLGRLGSAAVGVNSPVSEAMAVSCRGGDPASRRSLTAWRRGGGRLLRRAKMA
mmetsp:Transcript_128102/g.362638  ORF Transcript_128102/g.362638 Transcript_128102/m.362638 type:complete len:301 (-) Transcript_128102:7-909(-)